MIDAIPIEELLSRNGYSTPTAQRRGREALEAEGLTNPRKKGIHPQKSRSVETILRSRFFRHCGAHFCAGEASKGNLEGVLVASKDCQICQGRRAVRNARELTNACQVEGIERMLVVGGGPGTHEELRAVMGPYPRVDVIDGSRRADPKRARSLATNADMIVVWGSTILPHKVSELVTRPEFASKTVKVARRGVAALLEGAIEHCRLKGSRRAGH